MRIALVFPPLADATQPYSSLPALAGFLGCRGCHEAILHDANVEFVRQILTRVALEKAASRIQEFLRYYESEPDASGGEFLYNGLVRAALKAPVLVNDIDGAVAELTTPQTFSNLTRLDRARRVMQDAMEVWRASCCHPGLGGFELPDESSLTASDLGRLARDPVVNPFLAFLEEVSLPRLRNAAPGAIGISITYRTQILPAITLALLVKSSMPEVPVVFGGNIVSLWHSELAGCPEVFEWCDYLVAFEGESALDALLTALESGERLDGVPNLAYRRGDTVRQGPILVEDIDSLPAPDYRGLPLDLYLAPQPVFLLNTSRGCYWSKCEFCGVSPSMRNRCRLRRPELVLRDIAVLQDRHAARCIAFGDDCIPPRTLAELARGLVETGIQISWQCEVRLEPGLTDALLGNLERAGCRNLIFGLESYAPRVLGLMNKGIRHAGIARILDGCRRHGIAFNLQLFFGFPGETEDEAVATLDFAAGQLQGAATLSYGEFKLVRTSGVACRPDHFGVRPDNAGPLAINFNYQPVPKHAAEMTKRLRAAVLARTEYRSLPLCIDAHTLIFLHEAGVEAMAREYYTSSQASPQPRVHLSVSPGSKLVRKPRQTIASFRAEQNSGMRKILFYDYGVDRTVELSQLAHWIVAEQLGEPRSACEVVEQLVTASGDPSVRSPLTRSVNEILNDLLRRGMLAVVSENDEASMAGRLCTTT